MHLVLDPCSQFEAWSSLERSRSRLSTLHTSFIELAPIAHDEGEQNAENENDPENDDKVLKAIVQPVLHVPCL